MDVHVLASSSKGNCTLVSDGKTRLLLDCGLPIKAIRKGSGFSLHSFQACLVSHAHLDHSRAAADLAKAGLDVYASQGTIDACGLTGHRLHAVASLAEFNVGTFNVVAFDVAHDAPEPLGFLLTSTETDARLLYATDLARLCWSFRGVTELLVECNYDEETLQANVASGAVAVEQAERLARTHMSLERLLEWLRLQDLSRLQRVHLLHLSDGNCHATKCKQMVQAVTGVEVYLC